MSEPAADMPASSWKYLQSAAGSRLSSFKGYIREPHTTPRAQAPVPELGERQSWRAWAGEKVRAGIRRRGGAGEGREVNTEVVNLFPGWAARRYPKEKFVGEADSPRPFEVDVFISGFAITHRAPDHASRSQRAFIRLAKGFASLPKLIADDSTASSSRPSPRPSPSTEELLSHVHLPPTPAEITEDLELAALEHQLERAKVEDLDSAPSSPTSESASLASGSSHTVSAPGPLINATSPADALRRLHANLESRLRPFWASVLPGRVVRVRLYASPHLSPTASSPSSPAPAPAPFPDIAALSAGYAPLASVDVLTAPDGSFQSRFRVLWDELCHHPQALHIAFGEAVVEHELVVVAELAPPPLSVQQQQQQQQQQPPSPTYHPYTRHPHLHPNPSLYPQAHPEPQHARTALRLPITHSPIRLISDVDDTIKASNIPSGARAVFQAVFVKELRDAVVPGMGGWYKGMWERGVRFHYVSNGPFEYLPILNEFFQISELPPGSIKLKSYAGRSLFHGLLSAPAVRKRAGVVDVLNAFPESRFFLVGDSGEQDLELYADLARERADQILAVFIRDVSTEDGDPLDDPTGWKVVGAGAAGTRSSSHPLLSYNSTSSTSTASNTSDGSSKMRRTWSGALASAGKLTPLKINKSTGSGGDYFTSKPVSAEPEEVDEELQPPKAPFVYTPRTPRSATSLSAPTPVETSTTPTPLHPNATPHPKPQYITHPPSPIPPPSLAPRSHPPSSKSARSQNSSSSVGSANGRVSGMSEAEKRKYELQARVYRARTQMPGHVPLRVFKEPGECVEAEEILGREAGARAAGK